MDSQNGAQDFPLVELDRYVFALWASAIQSKLVDTNVVTPAHGRVVEVIKATRNQGVLDPANIKTKVEK